MVCKKHGEFTQLPWIHLKGHGCPACGRQISAAQRIKNNRFFERAKELHPEYDYSEAVYTGARQKLKFKCPVHGAVVQKAELILRGCSCPQCAHDRNAKASTLPREVFIAKATAAHPGVSYDYTKVSYVNNRSRVLIVCAAHGDFEQLAANHLRGDGCPACAGNRPLTPDSFTAKSRVVHGDKTYDYSKTNLESIRSPVLIGCRKHGQFAQLPVEHLGGHGCPACGIEKAAKARRHSRSALIKLAQRKHGDKFKYRAMTGKGSKGTVDIVCSKHGIFKQSWDSHIYAGSGCPKCNHLLSKGESEVADWMRSLGVEIEQRNRKLIAPQELDIVIPSRQLAVEYNGVYWHSAPIAARGDKAVRNYHAEKTAATTKAGYRLLTVWETDWKDRPETVKHWLWHQLGLQPKLAGARECACERVPEKEARLFYDRYHLQGACVSGKHFGLRHGGQLVALMTFTHSASDRKSKTVAGGYWLTRFALAGHVPGAASRLFAAAVAGLVAQQVTTYSDSTYAHGGVYARLGFQKTADIKPDYRVYHPFYGIQHKSFWQRRNIPDRLAELNVDIVFDPATDPRTEFGMEELLGCRHVWDAGKTRWEWQAAVNG